MSYTKGPWERYRLTFDGFGFNNADDPHKSRLATLPATWKDEGARQQFGHEVTRAVNCHADLLEALKLADELLNNSDVRYYISHELGEMSRLHRALNAAHAAIAKAEGRG